MSAVCSFIVTMGCYSPSLASSTKAVAGMECISSEEAMKKVKSGEVLLVCSYGDEKCKSVLFEGMLLSSEFEPKLGALSKTQEIIFYCSCPNDGTSASLAESYEAKRASQR